ncbi:DUF424 family protein [Candidatus Woesearchaeota archaeon]|nr:DUF424 family protein [Candidatus Woesearchaeota archaeon]
MIVKRHTTSDRRLILTICDDEILGRIYSEGEKQLDLSSEFYKGEKMAESQLRELVKHAYMINAVGKKSIKCCVDSGVIDAGRVATISKIPYAQMVRF